MGKDEIPDGTAAAREQQLAGAVPAAGLQSYAQNGVVMSTWQQVMVDGKKHKGRAKETWSEYFNRAMGMNYYDDMLSYRVVLGARGIIILIANVINIAYVRGKWVSWGWTDEPPPFSTDADWVVPTMWAVDAFIALDYIFGFSLESLMTIILRKTGLLKCFTACLRDKDGGKPPIYNGSIKLQSLSFFFFGIIGLIAVYIDFPSIEHRECYKIAFKSFLGFHHSVSILMMGQ